MNAKVLKAKLLKDKLSKRLALEAQIKLLEAEEEIELAELELQLADGQADCALLIDVMSISDKVERFLIDGKSEMLSHSDPKPTPTDPLSACVESIKSIMSGLKSPKIEMMNFSGEKLSYLIHYCHGQAKAAIESFTILPSIERYKEARRTLRDLYGQRHQILRAYLSDIIGTDMSIGTSPESLMAFSLKPRDCSICLKSMGCLADIDSSLT